MRLTSVIHSWPHISLDGVHFAITTLCVAAVMPENNSDNPSHSGEGQSSREDIALVPLFFSLVLLGDTNKAIYLAIRNCPARPMAVASGGARGAVAPPPPQSKNHH